MVKRNVAEMVQIRKENEMRIYNNIPMASVLFGIGGKQKIRVVDFTDLMKYKWYGADEQNVPFKEVYCGEWRDANCGLFFPYDACKVRGIEAKDDTLVFYLCSVLDKYEDGGK